MLKRIVAENWFSPKAVVGFWPAARDGDDIHLYEDEARARRLATFFTLRQQLNKRDGKPNVALADFVGPRSARLCRRLRRHRGRGGGGDLGRFAGRNDDYSSILTKALADRFAEALAEFMHARVRREFWGYAADETLPPESLIDETYRGIRPAPGYPAQPDHTEKATLFRLLDAEAKTGVRLTESFAMWPGSSVSGLYVAPPAIALFRRRQGRARSSRGLRGAQRLSVAEVERWLAPCSTTPMRRRRLRRSSAPASKLSAAAPAALAIGAGPIKHS